MTAKPEKVKEPSSGEAIASAADPSKFTWVDHKDLNNDKMTGEKNLIETFLDCWIIHLFISHLNGFLS